MALASNLSPAAQAVLEACWKARDAALDEEDMLGLAAALRAAVAHTQLYQGTDCLGDEWWTCDADELLGIAAELEGAND
jgi:hypothetical protein